MGELEMLNIPRWPLVDMTGYVPKTTFWMDFSIADAFGVKAVQDTFDRAFEEWKDDKVYGTELSMVLNWKQFQFASGGMINDNPMCDLYVKLWKKMDAYIMRNWKGEMLDYYIKETD